MKIIQLTDIHYGKKKEAIYGREPAVILKEAIKSINSEHNDAEFCILTGDLAHKGSKEAYQYLKEDLDCLKMPYYMVLGNHDNREAAKEVFSHLQCDENGFVQYEIECNNGAIFLMLDSLQGFDMEHTHAGFYCQKRLQWLKSRLQIHKDKKVYLCMHHAPFNTGIKAMDCIGLHKEDSLKLYHTLKSHGNIGHLFFGHYHSTLAGKWGDISFSTLKGISHQVKLDLVDDKNVWLDFRNPEYSVILLDYNQDYNGDIALEVPSVLCVHYNDFMFDKTLNIKEPL